MRHRSTHGVGPDVKKMKYILNSNNPTSSNIMLKIDITNAFNTVNRAAMLKEVQTRCPEIFNLVYQSYSFHSPLYVKEATVMSQTGVQQGDPLGPLLFALTLDPIIRSIQSPMNSWYLDDGVIAGPAHSVSNDLQQIILKLQTLGLTLEPTKCKIIPLSSPSNSTTAISQLVSILPGMKTLPKEQLCYLNSPILPDAIPDAVSKSAKDVSTICSRIPYLDSHTGLFILTHYASAPRLNYLMRSSPTFKCPGALDQIDLEVQEAAIKVTNVKLEGKAWTQATLPTRKGGLGLRSLCTLALPCFITSINKSLELMNEILPEPLTEQPQILHDALEELNTKYPTIEIPNGEATMQQRAWDDAVCNTEFNNLLNSANQIESARLLAAVSPHSGAWLHALPISDLGLNLDDEAVRIAVSLRVGSEICEPHKCKCGAKSDRLGLHGLACRQSNGRLPRHSSLNDIIKRGLEQAGIPAWLEPVGLDRRDGRRPDGITVFPFSNGRSLAWDATCCDTFCKTNIGDTAHSPGSAATKAEERKRSFYSGITARHRFEPVAVETTGVFGKSTSKFIAELGRRIAAKTGEKRETEFLRQRISLAIMRGNAASILATVRQEPAARRPRGLLDLPKFSM